MKKIKFCKKCKKYTLKDECPDCGEATVLNIPPKKSLGGTKAKYRRKIKKELLKKKGLL